MLNSLQDNFQFTMIKEMLLIIVILMNFNWNYLPFTKNMERKLILFKENKFIINSLVWMKMNIIWKEKEMDLIKMESEEEKVKMIPQHQQVRQQLILIANVLDASKNQWLMFINLMEIMLEKMEVTQNIKKLWSNLRKKDWKKKNKN